eukprot:TRINITY_DN10489_c0_g1_i1.p1 TRINITY_DN10489_c0_g1~~TRINITY_DN10489_c0_g1_i1.p1  ORF type:complete len:426 (+),score=75.72 TRINITY_DN10489_c0_g1_i1:76-1278(+)
MSKLPPPPPPPIPSASGSTPKRVTKAKETEDTHFKFNFSACISCPISPTDWDLAEGFTPSETGSEGVYFVQFPGNTALVIKSSSTLIGDMFAYEISKFAHINTPSFRIVRYIVDVDFKKITRTFERLDLKNPPGKQCSWIRSLDRPIFMVMEFVKGEHLHSISKESLFGVNPRVLSNKGIQVLREIGKISSFDVLINNWDRLPLLWNNDGNDGNIMFVVDKNSKDLDYNVVAIDSSLTSIDPSLKENFSEYIDKIKTIFNELCEYFGEPKFFDGVRTEFKKILGTPSIFNVKSFFTNNMGYDMTDFAIQQFIYGFMVGVTLFSKITLLDLQNILRVIEKDVDLCLKKITRPPMTSETLGTKFCFTLTLPLFTSRSGYCCWATQLNSFRSLPLSHFFFYTL